MNKLNIFHYQARQPRSILLAAVLALLAEGQRLRRSGFLGGPPVHRRGSLVFHLLVGGL